MGTIIEKLSYLNETKLLIKQAIETKGVEVQDETLFREYPELIKSISNNSVSCNIKILEPEDIIFVNGFNQNECKILEPEDIIFAEEYIIEGNE